jgi:ketosteroid isomerase-like protein
MRSHWVEIGRMDGPSLMRKVVAGFEKSDMGPLLAAMHDEIVWKSARRYDALFRSSGEYKTRQRVIELLSDLFQNYKFHRFEPKEIVAIGDIVWGHFDVDLSFGPKGSGIVSKHVDLEMAIRWRIQEGKIIEHHSFFDTASLLIQQTELARPFSLPKPKITVHAWPSLELH